MSVNDTTITIIGNLTGDPELRFTPSGDAVANFSIASTPRTFDRHANEWKDGETLYLRAAVWRETAENVAESLTKGMRVIVVGRLKARSYETKGGEQRHVIELEIDEIGPSLRWAEAKVHRTARTAAAGEESQDARPRGGSRGGSSRKGGSSRPRAAQGREEDPWATPTGGYGADDWGNGPDSEPPF